MYKSLLLTIFCVADGVLSSSISTKCKHNDIPCLEKLGNDLKLIVFAASPEHDIETSDPLFLKEITLDLSDFNVKYFNTSVAGVLDCLVSNVKLNEELSKVQFDFNCPKLIIKGKYDMSGQLLGISAEGNGDFIFITGKYFFHVEAEFKTDDSNDGKTHIVFKKIKVKATPQEPIKIDITNLFNGQKDLADAFIKFSKENWREIAEFIQDPFWYACFNKLFNHVNKHLKIIAVEDLITN